MNANRIGALGMYIISKTGKNFNFKAIRTDSIYRDILYTVNNEDYLVCEDPYELEDTIGIITFRFSTRDYPPKLIKKYTHKKFDKIDKKKREFITYKNKRYTLIKL